MKAPWRILVALAIPLVAQAQRPTLTSVAPGDTIRVWAVGPRLNGQGGIFSSFASDTLKFSVTPLGATPPVAVHYLALRRVDVAHGRGRSPGRIVVGTALGAAVGMIAGLAAGPLIECHGECGGEGEGIAGAIIGLGAGFVVGGVSGGLIGARSRTRWVSVSLVRP